ncbi:MAG: orotate phosphoribosyltransferase, partial [Staphylococcus epidermidis]|nr:orotate phosphoribosyltransferase [Staphylococcus epidermidis]
EEAGANVLGVVAIFTYGLAKADETFNKAHIPFYTLSDYNELIEVAKDDGKISLNDIQTLVDWRDNLS